jgi:putative transposase
MKKSRFSEEQIIAVLKEHQAGIAVADICRKHGISDATLYNWRNRYGGMEVSDARRLKALDDENRKLKKLLAESMLDVATLREALGKTYGSPRLQGIFFPAFQSAPTYPVSGADDYPRPRWSLRAYRSS